eukprot:g67108.t1
MKSSKAKMTGQKFFCFKTKSGQEMVLKMILSSETDQLISISSGAVYEQQALVVAGNSCLSMWLDPKAAAPHYRLTSLRRPRGLDIQVLVMTHRVGGQ